LNADRAPQSEGSRSAVNCDVRHKQEEKKMKITIMLRAFSLLLITGACWSVLAQTTSDEAQIRMIAANYERAWNKHDMKALNSLVTEDADFVNVGARHWKGRKEIEAQHTARLSQFMESF